MGLPSFGPVLTSSLLALAPTSALDVASVYTAAFAASIAAWIMACVIACASAILCLFFMSALKVLACIFFLVLFLLLTPCNFTCLSEDNSIGSFGCIFIACLCDTYIH